MTAICCVPCWPCRTGDLRRAVLSMTSTFPAICGTIGMGLLGVRPGREPSAHRTDKAFGDVGINTAIAFFAFRAFGVKLGFKRDGRGLFRDGGRTVGMIGPVHR